MRKVFLAIAMLAATLPAIGQHCYWVMLADKQGTTFDPYTYFDAKAIERYRACGADLYDISNYPLNESYVQQVNALATEEVGTSRWLNAVAVMATDEQMVQISQLPFVKEVVALEGDMQTAGTGEVAPLVLDDQTERTLHNQLIRMGGQYFRAKGIDGKGVRIAVFDGGFPQVNTHKAFQHLRDNHQIIKTWNFPNRKENVYGWNSHGLMTLSCIAGRHDSVDLGLATGAEFLLARTEVEAEPFKEEVWWQMAMEWADKNGAQIISSSLGYGKDRYYTKDMNGRSYVAKAGNMAARKGILVCNSAGNEGDDKSWRTIITPSDADSVLCVGGINPSLTDYQRTSFSSYGPSADGRQKPNVCAFAYAWTANTGASNDKYREVPGTSFSCPLVSGFAACAMQARPDLKGMALFHEIEKSADLYPYCDYTYGYGVPQADYFTGDRKPVEPTFRFEKVDSTGAVRVIPLQNNAEKCYLFVKNASRDGKILDYRQVEMNGFGQGNWMEIDGGYVVTVHYNGYTESYDTRSTELGRYMYVNIEGNSEKVTTNPQRKASFIRESKGQWDVYYSLGLAVPVGGEMKTDFWSPANRFGFRWARMFTKAYGWGFGLEYGINSYRLGNKTESNGLDALLGTDAIVKNSDKIQKHLLNVGQFSAEIFQRVRFVPGGYLHKGLFWDLGGYISTSYNYYRVKYSNNTDVVAESRELRFNNVSPLRGNRLIYGVATRLTYDIIGIYARYNLQNIGKTPASDEVALPRLEVGLQIVF